MASEIAEQRGTEDSSTTRPAAFWRRPQVLIIMVSAIVRLPLVFRPLTYRGDAWRQADTASIARNFARGDFEPFYPQINWGGAGPGYVETEFQLHPILTSLLYRAFGEHEWMGRALSHVFSVVALAGLWLLARRLLGHRMAITALVFATLSPIFIRYGSAFMPEATMLAAIVWALYLFDRWLDEPTWRLTLAAGLVTMTALLVKPTSAHLGITFAVLLVARHGLAGVLRPKSMTLAAISTVPVIAWLAHARSIHVDYGNTFGVISGGDRKLGDLEMYTAIGTYLPTAPKIDSLGLFTLDAALVFGLFAAPAFLIGLWRASAQRLLMIRVGTASVLLTLLISIRYSSQLMGAQYHVHAWVFAALGVALGWEWLRSNVEIPKLVRPVAVAGAVGFVLVAAAAYADQYATFRAEELACATQVSSTVGDDDLVAIISDSPAIEDERFENNFENPIIFHHADVYGWSIATDRLSPAEIERHAIYGADWLIVLDRDLVASIPAVAEYIATFADDQGLATGCGIYPLPGGS